MAKSLNLGSTTDGNPVAFSYSNTFILTRADDTAEQYITDYVVYSYYTDVNGINKCTGRAFVTFNVEQCKTSSLASTRRCSIAADDQYQDQTSSKNCQQFFVVSRNAAGEDPLTFLNFVDALPGVTFTDIGRSSSKEDQLALKYIEEDLDAQPNEVRVSPHLKYIDVGDNIVNIVTDSTENGLWYTRTITGTLINKYISDIATFEDDKVNFNVPYHRWTFSPSDMSAWSVQVTNLDNFVYSTTLKTGIKGMCFDLLLPPK
jgi:hypothetical protein